MALTDQEKERIIEEEKLRNETRMQQMYGHCGGRRGWRRGPWHYAFKILVVVLILGAVFWRPWHYHHGHYGDCYDKPAARAPAAEPAPKN